MARENYASGFVRNALGLPSSFEFSLSNNDISIINQHLSGKIAPEEALSIPVNDILKSIGSRISDECVNVGSPFVRKAFWPGAAEFAVTLTHDVDRLTAPLNHVFKVRKRFPTSLVIKRILSLEDPYWNIEKMAKLEAEFGFTSSFYLLVHDYDLADKREYVRDLVEKGWDIGLHGSFGTHESTERMREDIARFEKEMGIKPAGIREHYLKFDASKTWEIMDELGFVYDTTWGFNQKPGFKAGVSFPYHPPSSNFRSLRILEVPLVLMDTSLWGYMHLDEEQGYSEVEKVLARVKTENGLFTILWHQEALQMKGGRLYPRILSLMAKENCFVADAKRIAEWWINRENSVLSEKKEGKSFIYDVKPRDDRLVLEAIIPKDHKLKTEGSCKIVSISEARAKIATNGECIITIEGA